MQVIENTGQQAKEFLSTREAAKRLGVSLPTVQAWVESGVLPAWKTAGGHRRIPIGAVEVMWRSQRAALETARPQENLHVLVVEDEPVQRALYQSVCEKWGLPVKLFLAEDGFDGLMQIERHKPDLIITDLAMPGIDGFALVRKLVVSGYRESIIVVTALDAEQIAAHGGLPPHLPVFPKPIPFPALRPLIEQRLAKVARVAA